jgi:ABC-type multidrug transport system fused ATPase/permease subunit
LILDEATSAIDTITEQRLQLAVKKVLKGRTSIVIAHRLSTIVESDRILYIQNGTILEDGSHRELMEKKGAYWGLHQVG